MRRSDHDRRSSNSLHHGADCSHKHPDFHHIEGSTFDARLHIDRRLIVDKGGMLDRLMLHHPDLLDVASELGAPYAVLSPVTHEAHGSNTVC